VRTNTKANEPIIDSNIPNDAFPNFPISDPQIRNRI